MHHALFVDRTDPLKSFHIVPFGRVRTTEFHIEGKKQQRLALYLNEPLGTSVRRAIELEEVSSLE